MGQSFKPVLRPLPKLVGVCDICEDRTFLLVQCRITGLKACHGCLLDIQDSGKLLEENLIAASICHPVPVAP